MLLHSIWTNMSGFPKTILNHITRSCSGNSFRTVRCLCLLITCPTTYNNASGAVDIPPSQVNILDGTVEDLYTECKSYEDRIKSFNGIELFLGGIGEDGHIAFNEPGQQFIVSTLQADILILHHRIIPCLPHTCQNTGVRYHPRQCPFFQ